MRLHDMIKQYGRGKGEEAMWSSVRALSNYLDKHAEVLDDYDDMLRCIYTIMCGSHFNKEFAEERISKMYYTDKQGKKHMVKSDYGTLLESWFDEDKDVEEKVVEMACTFFSDVDSEHPGEKMWKYYD